jgi:excisionase family DNA binding protein
VIVSSNPNISPVVLNNHISVKAAALYNGYSLQYLRRMLRSGKLLGLKVGQLWLMDKNTFDAYLERAQVLPDRRFGPQ